MTQATIEIYDAVTTSLLPIPSKSHYIFNLRDMSKVFQGLLQPHPESFDNQDAMVRLWVHECYRVFYDRLVDEKDRTWFRNLVSDKLAGLFGQSWSKLFKNALVPTLFGNFMTDEGNYQELPVTENYDSIRNHMMGVLEEFNVEAGHVPMDLVLFKDAIDHVCRIHRIIRQPRGNALLVGVNGSGRGSLTRLAAVMAEYKIFQVEIKKGFRDSDFRDKLKDLYYMTGIEEKPTVFLFSDTKITSESFLEDISNILSRGEIPNLYSLEELSTIRDAMRQQEAEKAGPKDSKISNDQLYEKFIERAWNNIHVVLCMTPVGDAFRNRCRMFPALVNCTTIDWFMEWPDDALKEVALKFLDEVDLGSAEMRRTIADICVTCHKSAIEMAHKMAFEMKRDYTVTPSNYLQLVQGFIKLLKEKRYTIKVSSEKLSSGLVKLDDTRKKVEEMSITLEETKRMVAKLQKECEEYLMIMVQRRQEANEKAKIVAQHSERIAQEEAEVREIAAQAQTELDKALPALEVAKKALVSRRIFPILINQASLNKKDLSEVKAYASPPSLVEKVMAAVMVLRKSDTSWGEAKRQLNDPNFLSDLINYKIEKMTDAMLKKVEKYCSDPEFKPEKVVTEQILYIDFAGWKSIYCIQVSMYVGKSYGTLWKCVSRSCT
jgi:dynein heavy chain